METTATKEFEPSKDLALISLITLIKKLGFTYNTSASYHYSSGAKVRASYSYSDARDVFVVSYNASRNEGAPTAADKLCEIAQALMDKGLGVACHIDSEGEVGGLSVFAYDNAADLEAYEAKLAAEAREEAKVTPAVKADRISRAQDYLARQLHEAQEKLHQYAATTKLQFETLDSALASGNYDLASEQVLSLQKTGEEYKHLRWAVSYVASAQSSLNNCEALELKDANG